MAIKQIAELVKKRYYSKNNPFPPETFESHVVNVVKYSKMLAKKLNANVEVCELAAWLHDLGLVQGDLKTHHITGAKEAEKILGEFGYPKTTIEKIKHCISTHTHEGAKSRKTIEAKILASADVMSHFDGIPELYWVAFRIIKLNRDQGKKWVLKKLKFGWRELIPEAKKIIKPKYDAMRLLIEDK